MSFGASLAVLALVIGQFEPPPIHEPSESQLAVIQKKLDQLNSRLVALKRNQPHSKPVADIEISAKAAEWIVRHHEFFEPSYTDWTIETLDAGERRLDAFGEGRQSWFPREGSTVLGYYSRVDESVQPYTVTLPKGYDSDPKRRWPLYIELHGRNAKLNEVSFYHQWDGKPSKDGQSWVQLDVFGRTNNAYRWAGEADVFEALADLKQRVQIDEDRITLRGFSMGGAGTWHLGMHYPSLWSSIGAGAGFVDTVHHLGLEMPLSPLHQKLTKIYDAQEYALNAFNVPTIGYGGELDPQLFAAKTMHAKGQELGVPIEFIVGPQTAHKFHPESLKQFTSFLNAHSQQGRLSFPKRTKLKFVTYTLKYNHCDWISIEGQITPYAKSVVDAEVDVSKKALAIRTENAAALSVRRDVADYVSVDGGDLLSLKLTPGNQSPLAYYQKGANDWREFDASVSTQASVNQVERITLRKRHDLQGPIDDAFMQPFVCVRPTGTAWSPELAEWADWTLKRFEREFDHRLRGKIRIVDDTRVTDPLLESMHLVLFGDPGSNSVLARLVDRLPVRWTKQDFSLFGKSYRSNENGFAMIFPNPLNPQKYVVVNSGHTFHETEFANSNANLYPRLGDFGVIQFARRPDGGYKELVTFSDLFDAEWRFDAASSR